MNKIAEKAIGSAGAAVRALNPHLFPATGQLPPVSNPQVECAKPPKRIRQDSKPLLNKTEAAFGQFLRDCYSCVHEQSITFRIANGCRYTPDFVIFDPAHGVRAYEVKGFMRDDAAVKLKVAADKFPSIKFILVWKEKGQWQQQEVLP